jgi:hypothetical protein
VQELELDINERPSDFEKAVESILLLTKLRTLSLNVEWGLERAGTYGVRALLSHFFY